MTSLAEKYEASSQAFQTTYCLKLLRKLPKAIEEGWRVVDIGCGTGTNTEIVAKLVGENGLVLALDPNSERTKFFEDLVKANGLTQIVIRNVVAELGPYREFAPFDLAISNTVLHWIEETSLRVVMKKVYQSLTNGGYFAISVAQMRPDEGDYRYLFFNGMPGIVRKKLYERMYVRSLLWYTELLQEFGFEVLDYGYSFVECQYKDLEDIVGKLNGTYEGILNFEEFLTMDIYEQSGIYDFRKDGSFSAVNICSYLIAQKRL